VTQRWLQQGTTLDPNSLAETGINMEKFDAAVAIDIPTIM